MIFTFKNNNADLIDTKCGKVLCSNPFCAIINIESFTMPEIDINDLFSNGLKNKEEPEASNFMSKRKR